jgi:hypothetical protein
MPSKSFKPFDRGQSDSSNLLLAAQFDVADWRAAFDWSRRRSDTSSNFVSDGYRSEVGMVFGKYTVRWQASVKV